MATTNKAVSIVESIIHIAIMDVGVNLAIAAITAELPFLGLPVIKQVFRFIVEKLASFISVGSQTAAANAIIDAQTDAQAARYKEATDELEAAQSGGDPNALAQAREKYKEKLRELVRYNRTSGT